MKRFDLSKHITRFVMFLFIAYTCLLSSSVFAQLKVDNHAPKKISVSAYAALDSLTYDPSGAGVAYLDGSFYLENHDPRKRCTFTFEVRLDVSNADGITLAPDAKNITYGQLKKAAAPWEDIYDSYSDGVSLHIPCLGLPKPQRDDLLTMSATVTLNATIGFTKESWQVNGYTKDFTHMPETDEEEIHGIGPTTDDETFSNNCRAIGGEPWKSLVIADSPYDEIYWYIDYKGSYVYGEVDEGDGVQRSATMTYTFPADVGGQHEELAYYTITATVYRMDQTVYSESYQVEVEDAP